MLLKKTEINRGKEESKGNRKDRKTGNRVGGIKKKLKKTNKEKIRMKRK